MREVPVPLYNQTFTSTPTGLHRSSLSFPHSRRKTTPGCPTFPQVFEFLTSLNLWSFLSLFFQFRFPLSGTLKTPPTGLSLFFPCIIPFLVYIYSNSIFFKVRSVALATKDPSPEFFSVFCAFRSPFPFICFARLSCHRGGGSSFFVFWPDFPLANHTLPAFGNKFRSPRFLQ